MDTSDEEPDDDDGMFDHTSADEAGHSMGSSLQEDGGSKGSGLQEDGGSTGAGPEEDGEVRIPEGGSRILTCMVEPLCDLGGH